MALRPAIERRTVKAAIYVRVSTEEQAKEGISMKAQEERCKAYCKARGWNIYKVFRDGGYSAGSMRRPALKALLEDGQSKKYRVVVVYKIDRFSRKLKDLILTLEQLRNVAINFSSVTEQIDTTTAMGEAFFQIIGVFAQLERGMVKERVELAFSRKVELGECLNRAPLGYKYVSGRLSVNEEEARKVNEIFKMWASGVHYTEISGRFNISKSTLYSLIKNPTYVGKIRYKGQLYKGSHKPIVNIGLFNKVNSKSTQNS